MAKKPKLGYEKKKNKNDKAVSQKTWLASLLISPNRVSLSEKIIKLIIYIVLRIVIKPSKWRNPEKNLEVIDRAYRKIISSDFIYIPSSIAFYLIMAFMPILSLITFIYSMPSIQEFLDNFIKDGKDPLESVLGKFIPGFSALLSGLQGFQYQSDVNGYVYAALILSLVSSFWIASGGFSKIVFTQSYIYDHKFVGGYWMNRFRGMFMVLMLTFFLAITITINVTAEALFEASNLSSVWKGIFSYTFLIVGLLIALFIGFIGLFRYSPRFKIRIKDVVPGAATAAIPSWLFLSIFGSLTSILDYQEFGTIGVIMYIGIAMLFLSIFFFIGLTTNSAYYKTFINIKMRQKWSFSKK